MEAGESLAPLPDRYCFALSYRTIVNALTPVPIVGRFHCFPLNYNCWIMPPTFRCARVRRRMEIITLLPTFECE